MLAIGQKRNTKTHQTNKVGTTISKNQNKTVIASFCLFQYLKKIILESWVLLMNDDSGVNICFYSSLTRRVHKYYELSVLYANIVSQY